MNLAQQLAACDRETGLSGSLYDFLKIVWPQVYGSSPFVDNWHYPLICTHLEACYRGEIPELVINLPPGGGKSSLVCVVFPAWVWARSPERSIIHAAYGQKLVYRDAETMFKLMASPWWQERWGDRFALPTKPAIELIKNDKGGFRLGTTPGGEATGWHANYQILDDPQKPEDLTKIGLENTKGWITGTLDSRWRRPPQVTSRICIMQRLHCDDAAAFLLDRGAIHLMLPAQFDRRRVCVTPYGKDPRTEDGELLDPVRMPLALVKKFRRDMGGLTAAAQLDQNPVPEGGAVFKREFIAYWAVLPTQFDEVIQSWDCAFKAEESSDYVCGQVWGRIGANFYLLDQTHGHFDLPQTLNAIRALTSRWPQAIVKLVEDKANGPAAIQMLQSTIPGLIAVDPKGGKFSRASGSSGLFEAGNVFLPDPKLLGYEWVETLYLPELLNFPRSKKDDQVDATTQALTYMQENGNYLKAAMAEVRKWLGFIDLGD